MRVLAALLLVQSCFAGYTTVIPVTLLHATVSNTDQTSFVNMICANGSTSANCNSTTFTNLAVTQLKTIANGGVLTSSSGYDAVWFSASNCTGALNFEIVSGSYVATTGAVEFHVQKTRSHTVDDVIYLCLGNAAITTDQGGTTVWSGSSYKATLHLQEIHSTQQFLNSASTVGGSQYCGMDSAPTIGTAQIYKGMATSGSGNGGPCDDPNYPTGGAPWTLEMWMKNPNSASAEVAWGFGANDSPAVDGQRAGFYWANDGKLYMEVNGNGYISIPFTPDSNYHHFALVYAGGGATTGSTLFYKDGVSQTTTLGPSAGTTVFNISVSGVNSCYGVFRLPGNCSGAAFYVWAGDADELRASSVARSADWIASEYNNISSPSTFYSFGAPLTPGGGIRHRVVQ